MPFRGIRLKQLRERKGLTQDELAEKIGAGTRQIPRYEAGDTVPSANAVSKMAEVLEVSADYLLGLTDDPTARLREQDLSPLERRLIDAVRNRQIVEALQTFTELSQDDKKPPVVPD